jgi:signal peptide peptidase SppA
LRPDTTPHAAPLAALAVELYERPWAMERSALESLARRITFTEPEARLGAPVPLAFDDDWMPSSRKTERQAPTPVPILPVYGVITQRATWMSMIFGGASIDRLRQDLLALLGNPDVKAVVLDFNSPGGTVSGMTEFAAELRALRGGEKPIVGVVNPMCASAALWIAAQCDEIVITPSGSVGSIGVYAVHEEYSRLLDAAGVTVTVVASSPEKVEISEYLPLTADAEATIKAEVDRHAIAFRADMAKGRRVGMDVVANTYGQGRMLAPQDALKAGLIDRVDTLVNTVDRLARTRAVPKRARAEGADPELVADVDEDVSRETPVGPFGDRLTALADEAVAVAEHATERARLRAKEGRPAFSTTQETALRTTRSAIDQLLATADPESSEASQAPAVEPPVRTAPVTPPVAPATPAARPQRFKSDADWQRYLQGVNTR